MAEKDALEQLAEEELHRRDIEAYKEILDPMNEELAKRRENGLRWKINADEIIQAKADEKAEQERAAAEYKAVQEARKPEDTKEAYRQLLHQMKGED